ncbi:TPM domain-containing protein [Morganella psychrotolerans]|uniref:TPM domain-containing protein n=1 Tax=Morganella psychrotolerans TaxID=368603 RepID=UPI0039B128E9
MMRLVAGCLFLIFISLFARADGQSLPELKRERVIDSAGILTERQITELNNKLVNFENTRDDGTKFVIFLVQTTGKESTEQFSLRVFNQWKIGKEEKNNGILLVAAIRGNSIRFEIGNGIEAIIPSVITGRIINNYILPDFKLGLYYKGLNSAVDEIISLGTGEKDISDYNKSDFLYVPESDDSLLVLSVISEHIFSNAFSAVYILTFFCLTLFRTKKEKQKIEHELSFINLPGVKSEAEKRRITLLNIIYSRKYIYPGYIKTMVSALFYSIIIVLYAELALGGKITPDTIMEIAFGIGFISVFMSAGLYLTLFLCIPNLRLQRRQFKESYMIKRYLPSSSPLVSSADSEEESRSSSDDDGSSGN